MLVAIEADPGALNALFKRPGDKTGVSLGALLFRQLRLDIPKHDITITPLKRTSGIPVRNVFCAFSTQAYPTQVPQL